MEQMKEFKYKVPLVFEFELYADQLEEMAFLQELSPTEAALYLVQTDYKDAAFGLADQLIEHCNQANE